MQIFQIECNNKDQFINVISTLLSFYKYIDNQNILKNSCTQYKLYSTGMVQCHI